MAIAARRRPTRLPEVRPVHDHEASPEIAQIYSELKAVLQVPWVAMITRAYARYPTFFATLWHRMREVCGSEAYVRAAQELSFRVDEDVAILSPPPVAQRLRRRGYLDEDIRNIRRVLEVLSHGNNMYQPLVMAALVLLDGGSLGSDRGKPRPFKGRHAPRVPGQFILMEAHHAALETQALYHDIKTTLGLLYVNSDYRALACWPSYLALVWQDLKPVIGTDRHRELADAYHQRSMELTERLPNPGRLTPMILRAAAEKDASVAEVSDIGRFLLYNIPPLMINVAYLRYQISSDQ